MTPFSEHQVDDGNRRIHMTDWEREAAAKVDLTPRDRELLHDIQFRPTQISTIEVMGFTFPRVTSETERKEARDTVETIYIRFKYQVAIIEEALSELAESQSSHVRELVDIEERYLQHFKPLLNEMKRLVDMMNTYLTTDFNDESKEISLLEDIENTASDIVLDYKGSGAHAIAQEFYVHPAFKAYRATVTEDEREQPLRQSA